MKKHRLLASVLSVMLAASAAMTCYAATAHWGDGAPHTVEGDVVNTDYSQTAVSATGSGTSVTVNGGVESAGAGVKASAGGAVTVSESVESDDRAVIASDNSSVSIGGDVKSSGEATVNVSGNSNVTIGGGINSTTNMGYAIGAYEGSTANVTGDVVSAEDAIDINNSTVTVGGSVQASDNAVNARNDSNVNIGGSATSSGWSTIAANDSTVTVGNDVNNTGVDTSVAVRADNGSTVDITGSVTSQGEGINADNNSTVTVGKDVVTEGEIVLADNQSTVNIGGDAKNNPSEGGVSDGVFAQGGSTVNIGGNVDADADVAVHADEKSTVTVGGNVNADSMVGVGADDGSIVIVEGSVINTGDDAIGLVSSDCKVIVKGDASGGDDGISISETPNNSGAVVVLGTVTAGDRDDSYCISVSSSALTQDEVMEMLPTIIVGELSSANEQFVNYEDYSGTGTLDTEAVAQAIAEQILYYIEVQDTENGSIKIDSGTTKVEGYDVARANDTVTVTVTADQGYEIQTVNGGKATAVKNEDGSWSITVPKTGGVSISAIMAAIKKVEDDTSDNSDNNDNNNSDSGNGSSNTNKKYSSDSDGSGDSSSSSSYSGSSQSGIPETEGTWKQGADGNWYMQTTSGATYKNTWLRSNGSWYYAGPSGIITKGWLKIGNYWYYFANDGKMLTGWVEIDGKKYHLNDSLASLPIGAWIEE